MRSHLQLKKYLKEYFDLTHEDDEWLYADLIEIINRDELSEFKVRSADMKNAYRYFTKESWSKTKALPKVWQAAWEMAIDSMDCRLKVGYYEPQYPTPDPDDYDPHIGCYSYPNCDIDPNGCCVINGADAEPYGHRD